VTQIVWLQAALEDLRGIHGYIARDNPAAARRVIGSVRDQVKALQAHPSMGRPGRIAGTRTGHRSLSRPIGKRQAR
jgi:toxin ParE1/3/4